VPDLLDALNEPSSVAGFAALALGRIGDAAAIPALARQLDTPIGRASQDWAISAIARIGGVEAVRGYTAKCFIDR